MSQLKLFYKAYKECQGGYSGSDVSSGEIEEYFENVLELKLELLDEEFEEGGRWYNNQTKTYKLGEEYYQLHETIGATENQEDGYGVYSAQQVVPKETIAIVYKGIKGESIQLGSG